MLSPLCQLYLEAENELVHDIMCQLRQSTARHYAELEEHELHRRVQKLVAHFEISLRERPAVFSDYVGTIVEERIAEGFVLAEILTSMRILEEKCWQVAAESLAPRALVPCLARVTGTIGAAKDRLAEQYVRHLEKAEDEALLWQRRYEELAARVGVSTGAGTPTVEA
jgi:hypothetical protein